MRGKLGNKGKVQGTRHKAQAKAQGPRHKKGSRPKAQERLKTQGTRKVQGPRLRKDVRNKEHKRFKIGSTRKGPTFFGASEIRKL